MKPTLTIIIPMYNVANFITTAVESVKKQDVDFDYEIIMVNDGSPDNSCEIAMKISAENGNITVISQDNKGLGGARNTGIINANGKYLLFLDADDQLAEHSLSKLIEKAEQEKVDILEFAAQGRDEKGKVVYEVSNKTNHPMSGKQYYNSVRYMNSACNKIYKTSFLKQNILFFKEQIYIEDFEFNTRVFSKAEKVLATDIVGAYFLQTADSITRTVSDGKIKKMQDDIVKVIEITANLFEKDNASEQDKFFYKERLGFLTATLFYQLYKRGASYEEIKALKKELLQKNIFYPDYKIYDQGKEIFRRILIKNLYFYPLFITFKKWM